MEDAKDKRRLLIENLPDPFVYHQVITDSAGKPLNFICLDVNHAFEKMTGQTRDQIIGKKVTEVLPGLAESSPNWVHTCAKVAFNNETIRFAYYAELQDRWYEITAYSDEPGCFAVIFRDITARKQAKEAMRRREQDFRALTENSPDVVARFDRNMRRLYINPAVEKYTGVPREKLIGRTHEALKVPARQVRLWNDALREVFQSGTEKELYHDFEISAGHRYFHSRIVPELADDGSVETVLAITRDITNIKKMEAALQKECSKTSRLHLRSLPDVLPVVPGFALAARYQPSPKLRGDFYKVICLKNQLLLYLVDIDKNRDDGVMQSNFVRKAIEEYLSYEDRNTALSPAKLLGHLTEQYQKDNESEMCPLRLFIAVFELPQTDQKPDKEESLTDISGTAPGELRYVSTGFYTPPLLSRGSGEPVELSVDSSGDKTGPLPPFREDTVRVIPGSTFFFCTDGLFRQENGKASYKTRLRELFNDYAHLPPELISRTVKEDFAKFYSHTRVKDDFAYLVVQTPEHEQRLSFKIESDFAHITVAEEKVSYFLASHLQLQPNLLNFHELLVNAIEHGNKRDGGKKVSVDVIVTERYYKIIITDQGDGFNWQNRINRELELDGNSDRGRGIIMTRMMTDYLGYNKRGNRATMINLIK